MVCERFRGSLSKQSLFVKVKSKLEGVALELQSAPGLSLPIPVSARNAMRSAYALRGASISANDKTVSLKREIDMTRARVKHYRGRFSNIGHIT
jgi:hypothetical protein